MLNNQKKQNHHLEEDARFIEDVEKIKERVDHVNRFAISSLEDIHSNYM